MENYYDEMLNIYSAAVKKLTESLEEGMVINLCEIQDEDGYTDAFYELPIQYLYGKYNYALPYNVHSVYMEDGKVYFKGREMEEGDDYDFSVGDLNLDVMVMVIDEALPLIEDAKVEWEKTMKRCSD